MDNFTKLIKESLLNNFLNESMALLKDLENHTDFDTLITSLEDSLGIKMERTLRSGTYNGREGYYLRTKDVGAWTENAKGSITRALDKANAKAQDYTFEFENVSDFEEDPGERTWDAAIEFFADKEEEEEMWTDPAGGTHYGDDDDPASDYMEESVNEAKLSTIHNAAKQGSYPVTMVVTSNGKVIKQELVGTPAIAPAAFNQLQKEYPNATISIEDRTGKILFTEPVNEDQESKVKDKTLKALEDWYDKSTPSPSLFDIAKISNMKKPHVQSVLRTNKTAADAMDAMFASINEMDRNDPVLMGMRANKPTQDTDSTSGIDYDEALSLRIMRRELEKEIDQLWMDMEQEAEPEGGPIADRYGDEISSLEDRIYKISIQLMDYDMNEELETPNELADESKQDTSASGAYESKEFDFKKMIKEAIITQLIKTK